MHFKGNGKSPYEIWLQATRKSGASFVCFFWSKARHFCARLSRALCPMNRHAHRFILGTLIALLASSCGAGPIKIPPSVKAGHEDAVREAGDEFPEPATFVGSLDRVLPTPYRNVHGIEWGMRVRVEQVLIGKLDEKVIEIGISDPDRPPLQMGKKYYLTVGPSHHGNFIYEVSPIEEK